MARQPTLRQLYQVTSPMGSANQAMATAAATAGGMSKGGRSTTTKDVPKTASGTIQNAMGGMLLGNEGAKIWNAASAGTEASLTEAAIGNGYLASAVPGAAAATETAALTDAALSSGYMASSAAGVGTGTALAAEAATAAGTTAAVGTATATAATAGTAAAAGAAGTEAVAAAAGLGPWGLAIAAGIAGLAYLMD